MPKIAVVFWSGSGSTEAMAQAIGEGAAAAGAEVKVLHVSEFSPEQVSEYQGFCFGCPAMGAEELEDSEFEPVLAQCEPGLSGMPVALFGSYGWGSGEWMATWQARTEAVGAKVVDTLICQGMPDGNGLADCQRLGAAMAAAI